VFETPGLSASMPNTYAASERTRAGDIGERKKEGREITRHKLGNQWFPTMLRSEGKTITKLRYDLPAQDPIKEFPELTCEVNRKSEISTSGQRERDARAPAPA